MNIVAQCREQSAASIANHQWDKVIDELERLLYATANGFKPTKLATSKPNKNKANTANPINLNV
jgi:hypothetical protein